MPSGNAAVAREEVELSFKRYILEKTEDFEREPMADLYRVNLLCSGRRTISRISPDGCAARVSRS